MRLLLEEYRIPLWLFGLELKTPGGPLPLQISGKGREGDGMEGKGGGWKGKEGDGTERDGMEGRGAEWEGVGF